MAALALGGVLSPAQTRSSSPADLQMIVTVADHTSHKPVAFEPADVKILNGTITDWRLLEANDLELFLVIDDAANYDFVSRLIDLRDFVTSQPAAAAIGLAYIHDGRLQIVLNPTTDHASVARVLRVPSGSTAGNPYCALTDLMERWPQKSLRREIVLVSTGVDDSAVDGALCVNAETAIHDAERAGVQIYALYNPIEDFLSESWTRIDTGVTELAHVCYETGGEAYLRGHEVADSFAPYLADIADHLAHQYLVKFRFAGGIGSGFQQIYIRSGPANPELMVPESIWVPSPRKNYTH
jgi:hypothetical protein